MQSALSAYIRELTDRFGSGWNRFWFVPSDPAPLCAMRVLIGLIALYMQLTFTFDLQAFFGPGGLLPQSLNESLSYYNRVGLSIFHYTGSTTELWIAHWLCTAAIVLFS